MLAQPRACLIELGGEVRRRMRRPAWQHMMHLHRGGLPTRRTPLQAMTAPKEGGYGGMVGGWEYRRASGLVRVPLIPGTWQPCTTSGSQSDIPAYLGTQVVAYYKIQTCRLHLHFRHYRSCQAGLGLEGGVLNSYQLQLRCSKLNIPTPNTHMPSTPNIQHPYTQHPYT